jgi:hypothetical protein
MPCCEQWRHRRRHASRGWHFDRLDVVERHRRIVVRGGAVHAGLGPRFPIPRRIGIDHAIKLAAEGERGLHGVAAASSASRCRRRSCFGLMRRSRRSLDRYRRWRCAGVMALRPIGGRAILRPSIFVTENRYEIASWRLAMASERDLQQIRVLRFGRGRRDGAARPLLRLAMPDGTDASQPPCAVPSLLKAGTDRSGL